MFQILGLGTKASEAGLEMETDGVIVEAVGIVTFTG